MGVLVALGEIYCFLLVLVFCQAAHSIGITIIGSRSNTQQPSCVVQAGELPNLRWQIGVLVANIERLNNAQAGAASAAAADHGQGQDHQGRAPEPHSQDLKHSGAQGAASDPGLGISWMGSAP